MTLSSNILSVFVALLISASAYSQKHALSNLEFYGQTIEMADDSSFFIDFSEQPTIAAVQSFYSSLNASGFESVLNPLLSYKTSAKPDDWLYYQLIRKTAQQLSPKAENYNRYTLYKWFLLSKSGYDVMLCTSGNQLLFYVQSDENIYNIPYRIKNGKQYVCLNYHDFGAIDFTQTNFVEIPVADSGAHIAFSYKLTRLPDFKEADYISKDLHFSYNDIKYRFEIKLNTEVKNIFRNYPVVDYASYFNAPLSKEPYGTLIPALKNNIKGLSQKNGVDYLMHFTRYAFSFETDTKNFGQEKRLTPEQTLLYENSDCEDRAALFFYLVKEIYNLPMILLVYPDHVTTAIKFDKPIGKTILYKGQKYSVCEPTPQDQNLLVGQMLPALRKKTYEVAYAYFPGISSN